MDKIILDACCGSRMFWFDKKNPLTLFVDIRDEEHVLCDGRDLKVHPDLIADFTNLPFLIKVSSLSYLIHLICLRQVIIVGLPRNTANCRRIGQA